MLGRGCGLKDCRVLGFSRQGILGGSWVVISGVISPLIWVISIVILLVTLLIISIVILLVTLLIATHEPPSRP